MFVVPEVLFSFLLSSVLFLFGINGPYLIGNFISPQFITDNQSITFLALAVEIVGILGLLVTNIESNRSKLKLVVTTILSIFLIFAALVFYTIFSMRHGIGF